MGLEPQVVIATADLRTTESVAARLAALLAPGDLVLLEGDLGTGKTAFARALLRSLAADPALDVPSPTYTLAQSYEIGSFAVLHADLYRLRSPEEALQLGLDEALEHGAALVEWPDKAETFLPDGATLRISFEFGPTDPRARVLRIGGDAGWTERLPFLAGDRSV